MFNSDDQQQIMQFREIRNHLIKIMPRATIGLADAVVISELEHILADLSLLFNELSPQRPACEPTDVQSTIAETMIHLANAYDALRSSEQALNWYEQAASVFEAIGKHQSARQCQDAIARLYFSTRGAFDAEFQRLQERLTAQPKGSLPSIETLIALGDLYKAADDLFEAERTYVLAEKALEPINPASLESNPALTLEQVLSYYQEIEFLYDLRYRLCSNLMYLYRDRDSAQSNKCFQRALENESRRSKYRHSFTARIVSILLAEVYEAINTVVKGLQTNIQLDSLLGGIKALAASNMSLPIDAPRDRLLQELQELLISTEEQGPVQVMIHHLQLYVRQHNAFIEGIYQRQAIELRADMLHLLEVQLTFDALRQDVQAFATQTSEQQAFFADKLLQRNQALKDESQRLDLLEGVTTALILKSELLMTLQRNDEAITALVEARRVLGDHWQHDRGVAILSGLAEANARKHDWAAVVSICHQGIELIEQYRYEVTGQYLQSSYLASRIRLYSLGVRAAYELGNYVLMVQWAELSKCRSILRYQQQILVPAQDLHATEQEFQRVCEQLHLISSDSVFSQELRQKRRTLWDLLLIQRYQEQTGKDFPEFSLQGLQNTLANDEAVIYYYWLDIHTLLIISIDQHSIIAELRTIAQEQRKKLEDLAQFVLNLQDLEREGGRLQKIMEFSSLLLPQAGMALLEQKRRLFISPHRMLHVIPFHALQLGTDFLIQHFAVSYVPNLTSLLFLYISPAKSDVLALGICEYNIPGEQANILKDAESEVEDVKKIYEDEDGSGTVTLLKGPEARRKQLQLLEVEKKLEQFTCLHFATHGKNVMTDTPMESCLLLQDTLLDGLEIANWKLNAEIVVLSACCSGQRAIAGRGLAELPGDELLGLQAAFFCAGSKRLLCSLWPVDSPISHEMSVSFHRYMIQGYLPEVALQTAMKDYLANARLRGRRLCYWAPFFLATMARPELTSTLVSEGGNTK